MKRKIKSNKLLDKVDDMTHLNEIENKDLVIDDFYPRVINQK